MHVPPLRAAVGALSLLVFVGCDAAGPDVAAVGAQQETVPVCHYDGDTGTYALLSLADRGAQAHGDRHARDHVGPDYEGAAVPEMDGFVFDAACQPVPAYTVVDFGGASSTVGDQTNARAIVRKTIQVGDISLIAGVEMYDYNNASDGGYQWLAGNLYYDFSTRSFCHFPVVGVRARAELDGTSYPIEFDGYESDGYVGPLDLEGPWDWENGDRPTLVVESMTLDLSVDPVCR